MFILMSFKIPCMLECFVSICMLFLDCDPLSLPVELWAMPLDDFEHDVVDCHAGDGDNHRLA
jgi:hypothetical protein